MFQSFCYLNETNAGTIAQYSDIKVHSGEKSAVVQSRLSQKHSKTS